MSRPSRAVAVCILVLGGCLSLSGIPAAAPRITITDLGTLGGDWALVADLNESGQVAGESGTADGQVHAFFWTAATGMIDLGVLPDQHSSEALAMNDLGQVVGRSDGRAFIWSQAGGLVDIGPGEATDVNNAGQVVGQDGNAFLWTQAGGRIDLGTLAGDEGSTAWAVSETGQVVGESYSGSGSHAFSWTQAGGMVDLGTLGGSYSSAGGVNEAGQVIGYSSTAGDAAFHAFSWTQAGGIVDLGTLGGDYSAANDLNNVGQIVGVSSSTGNLEFHAFSWTEAGGMVDLGAPPGRQTWAVAVNDAGRAVGHSTAEFPESYAFSWTAEEGLVALPTLGGTSSSAWAVNNANQIAGESSTPGNVERHAVLWTIVTLPSTANDCRNGGWKTYESFKNQGDCVSFLATGGKNTPAR